MTATATATRKETESSAEVIGVGVGFGGAEQRARYRNQLDPSSGELTISRLHDGGVLRAFDFLLFLLRYNQNGSQCRFSVFLFFFFLQLSAICKVLFHNLHGRDWTGLD